MAENLALYRKYRPTSFDEVVGQDHIVSVLKEAVNDSKIGHAYLFSGPRGSGKTSVARIFAKAAACFGARTPCNQCQVCQSFAGGNTLDLVEIDAASNRGIDEVRALKEQAYLMPINARRKCYIIDEAHMMTKDAFNAFLKILEEPPAHVLFILATTEPDKLLETVVSRTQHFRFKPIREKIIQKAIENVAEKEAIGLTKTAASALAFLADGSLRDALNHLAQAAAVDKGKVNDERLEEVFGIPPAAIAKGMTEAILAKNAELAFKNIRDLENSGGQAHLLMKILLRNFRHLLLAAINPAYLEELKSLVGEEEYNFISAKYRQASLADIERALTILLESANTRLQSPYPTLHLELAMARILQK